jgi:hypothetical protein
MKLGEHRSTLLLFGLTLGVLFIMQGLFPADLAIPLPGSDIRPVLLLEFANTPAHLLHIFGEQGDPQRAERIVGMTAGNRLDYLLMPAYGLLTLSFFRGVARETGQTQWRLIGWLGIVAAISDAVENAIMFLMVDRFVAGADVFGLMAILPFPVWIKFGLLAASCGAAAWGFTTLKRYLLALICVAAPLLLIPGVLAPFSFGPTATSMIALGWIAMAVHSATRLMGWPQPRTNPAQSKL